jgi:hypothetical protein
MLFACSQPRARTNLANFAESFEGMVDPLHVRYSPESGFASKADIGGAKSFDDAVLI